MMIYFNNQLTTFWLQFIFPEYNLPIMTGIIILNSCSAGLNAANVASFDVGHYQVEDYIYNV